MGIDYLAGIYYGFPISIQEVHDHKFQDSSQEVPELEKYIKKARNNFVLEHMQDLTLSTVHNSPVMVDHHQDDLFYIAIRSTLKEVKEYEKCVEPLPVELFELTFPQEKANYKKKLHDFCEMHNLPYKEPTWNLFIGHF